MVLYPSAYIAPGNNKENTQIIKTSKENVARLSRKVAEAVCDRLRLDPLDDEYLFVDGPWMEPGPEMTMDSVFRDWSGTVLRPVEGEDSYVTWQTIVASKKSRGKP